MKDVMTTEVWFRQVSAMLHNISDWSMVVLAYEPVWAIGIGKKATSGVVVHLVIRELLAKNVNPEVCRS